MSEARTVFTGWIDRIGDYAVERVLIPRPGNKPYYTMQPTGRLILHTMESLDKYTRESRAVYFRTRNQRDLVYRFDDWTEREEELGFEAGVNQLRMSRSAPHVSIGAHRIIQHRPIGVQAAALRGTQNARAYIQIELNANTEGRKGLWMPTPGTLEPLVAFLAFAFERCGIPARVPGNFPDDMSDCKLPWAVETNSRRRSSVWEQEQGVFMHLEVDGNTHFDCALMERSKIIGMATSVGQAAPQGVPQILQLNLSRVLQLGMTGDDVLNLNVALLKLGYQPDSGNSFKGKADNAVRLFQSIHDLSVDGRVGPNTTRVINEELKRRGITDES
jgi:hypothetical protein